MRQGGSNGRRPARRSRQDVSVVAGEINLRLETFNAADDASFTHSHGGEHPFETAHGSFALMFATRLPPELEPGADPFAAVLRARRDARGGGGSLENIVLVALTVDRISTVAG